MSRYALPLVAVAGLATPAAAADIQIQATGPVVELSIVEEVEAEPDMVRVSAGVTTDAPTAVEALRLNSQAMQRVIDRLKALRIPERDIQTTGINLNPRWDYDQASQKQIFRGYQAANRVSIKLRGVERTGEILDALVAAGATDLSGPDFSIENDTQAKATARRNAMERAQSQAMEYARLAGYSGLRLLEVNETIVGRQPMPMYRDAIAVTAQAAAPPVQPGMVSTGVNIIVKYEMTR